MSNLVKQYFVSEVDKSVRVIDSNVKLEAKFKEMNLAKETISKYFPSFDDKENNEENFSLREEGNNEQDLDSENALALESDDAYEPEQYEEPNFTELIEEANENARAIIADAQEKADLILEDAHIKASQIYEEKKQQGYTDGMQESEQEIQSAKQKYEKEYLDLKTKLEQDFAIRNDTLESDLIDAIIMVFNNVFHIQFDDKKEILLYLVKNTISKVEVGKEFRVHVAQNNYKFMLSRIEEIRERIGNDVEIEIVNDANLESADCQIETSFGVFDCGIDMELANLVKDIRSLCSK